MLVEIESQQVAPALDLYAISQDGYSRVILPMLPFAVTQTSP